MPTRTMTVAVDPAQTFQPIDGFGVNTNSKAWEPRLMPAMELLTGDLGATLFRVDVFGKSNWPDPFDTLGPRALEPERLAQIYQSETARRGWAMMRFLNERGIEPYLTCSGIVPRCMCAEDGKTLADYEGFSEMLASMVEWARNREGLRFTLFGPLNETNLGPPEGPRVTPHEYACVLEVLDQALARRGLDDIRLVVAEEAGMTTDYMQPILDSSAAGRVGVWAMHCYGWYTPAQFAAVRELAGDTPLWMTEYGDLEQTGEREWPVAWNMTQRLFDLLEHGFRAALVWDAYDNYHDHDEHWTLYGLIRTGLRAYTPKKRYYAQKQVFRFVRPGMQRIAATCPEPGVRVLAFANTDRSQVTVVGLNGGTRPAHLNVDLSAFPEGVTARPIAHYRTSEHENCVRLPDIPARGGNWPVTGVDVIVPPDSIVTLTNCGEVRRGAAPPQEN
jgi:O-glycosyl hydrolase